MALGVTVIGVQKDGGGLKRAMAEIIKHNKSVADALLNVSGIGTATGEPVDEDDPREAYDPKADKNQWPKMLYHPDGRQVLSFNFIEVKDAQAKGFRLEPYIKPQVAVLDPATEKKMLLDRLNQMEAEKTQNADIASRALQRLEELEARFAALTTPKEKK